MPQQGLFYYQGDSIVGFLNDKGIVEHNRARDGQCRCRFGLKRLNFTLNSPGYQGKSSGIISYNGQEKKRISIPAAIHKKGLKENSLVRMPKKWSGAMSIVRKRLMQYLARSGNNVFQHQVCQPLQSGGFLLPSPKAPYGVSLLGIIECALAHH